MPVPETDHLMTGHQTTKTVVGNHADRQTDNVVCRQIVKEGRKTSIHEEVIEGVFKAVPVLLDDSMGEEEDILGKYFITILITKRVCIFCFRNRNCNILYPVVILYFQADIHAFHLNIKGQ